LNPNHLTQEQQEEIVALIQDNKVLLTAYIRSNFKNISNSDIEDCFQNLFVRIYEKFSSFEDSKDKIRWLLNTMKNIMHEFCRKKKKHYDHTISESLVPEAEEKSSEEKDLIFEIVTNHFSEDQIVQIILSHLTEKEQYLYRLRYMEKLSTDKIADRLSLPSGTVRGRLSDLKKKVKKLIHEYDTIQWNQKEKFSENFSKNSEHSDKN